MAARGATHNSGIHAEARGPRRTFNRRGRFEGQAIGIGRPGANCRFVESAGR